MTRLSVTDLREIGFCAAIALGLSAGVPFPPAAGAQFLPGHEGWAAANHSSSAYMEALQPSQQSPAARTSDGTVSLAPAIVMVQCKLGQSYTQLLTLTNHTRQEYLFEMVAQDVIVRAGQRNFVPAGETAGSIAATAVFSQRQVVVKPGESSTVGVTFTPPPETPLRAAVAIFRGLNSLPAGGPVMMTASLGALFTFTVSDNFQIEASPIAITPQTGTTNLGISQVLTNTGTEPVIARGIAAVLNERGMLLGKASFEEQRLLPGEKLPFSTEYAAELKAGHYRVLASIQYEEKVFTHSTDLTVP